MGFQYKNRLKTAARLERGGVIVYRYNPANDKKSTLSKEFKFPNEAGTLITNKELKIDYTSLEILRTIKDYKEIVEFIKKNYSSNHILTKNKKVFFYFYAKKKKLNFLILKYKKKIISILGFLINNHKKKYIWLALWVSKKNQIFSGIKLLKRLENNFNKKIFVLGLNDYGKKIMEQLNYKIKTMNHYYFINNNVDKFKIIKNPLSNKKKVNKNSSLFFEEIKRKNLNQYNKIILSRSLIDFKDFKFKYINNQFYHYKFYL
jgi:hypothetical protein